MGLVSVGLDREANCLGANSTKTWKTSSEHRLGAPAKREDRLLTAKNWRVRIGDPCKGVLVSGFGGLSKALGVYWDTLWTHYVGSLESFGVLRDTL